MTRSHDGLPLSAVDVVNAVAKAAAVGLPPEQQRMLWGSASNWCSAFARHWLPSWLSGHSHPQYTRAGQARGAVVRC